MHKSESVLANEVDKIFWDLGIQTNHQMLTRRPVLEQINKQKRTYFVNHRVKITKKTITLNLPENLKSCET